MYFSLVDTRKTANFSCKGQEIMQIFVRTLDDRTLTLDVQHDDTINDIKEIVEQREGNRQSQQNKISKRTSIYTHLFLLF